MTYVHKLLASVFLLTMLTVIIKYPVVLSKYKDYLVPKIIRVIMVVLIVIMLICIWLIEPFLPGTGVSP